MKALQEAQSIDQFLESQHRTKPVLLFLDGTPRTEEIRHSLIDMLELPSIKALRTVGYVTVYERSIMHPEMQYLLQQFSQMTGNILETQALAVLTSNLSPISIITTRSTSGRLLPEERILAQLQSALETYDDDTLGTRAIFFHRTTRKVAAQCFSAVSSEQPDELMQKLSCLTKYNDRREPFSHRVGRSTTLALNYLSANEAGLERMFSNLFFRQPISPLLTLAIRTCLYNDSSVRQLVRMNMDKVLTTELYDIVYGGVYTSTNHQWTHAQPIKFLAEQVSFINLCIELAKRHRHLIFKLFAEQTLQCCLRDFCSDEAELYDNSTVYANQKDSLLCWRPSDFEISLSFSDSQIIKNTLAFRILQRDSECRVVVRLKDLQRSAAELQKCTVLADKIRNACIGIPGLPAHSFASVAANAGLATLLAEVSPLFPEMSTLSHAMKITQRLWQGFDTVTGHLAACFEGGRPQGRAALADYALLTEALFSLYDQTLDLDYLQHAQMLHSATRDRYWDENNGIFRIFSYIHELNGFGVLDGGKFFSGVSVACANHARWLEMCGHDALSFAEHVYELHRNSLNSYSILPEALGMLDFLNRYTSEHARIVINQWPNREEVVAIVAMVKNLPIYCRPYLFRIDTKQTEATLQALTGIDYSGLVSNTMVVLQDSVQMTTFSNLAQLDAYLQEVKISFEKSRIRFSGLPSFNHFFSDKQAKPQHYGV